MIEGPVVPRGAKRRPFFLGRLQRRVLAVAGAAASLALAGVPLARPAGADAPVARSVLVVGDSIVMQASAAISYWAPPGSTVWPEGAPGTAPCDWSDGWRNPESGLHLDFDHEVDSHHPAAVVLAFSGNPGLSGPRSGCVDAHTDYPLSSLLASYERSLLEMARYAATHGARVYLAASPPRNPATAPGVYRGPKGARGYGYNGVPAINRLYQALVASPEGQADAWVYDEAAAASVSDLSLTWHLRLTCMPWDAFHCQGTTVQVRDGGYDAIHLDPWGNGAARYGMAIVRLPLENQLL